jgi:hypothetical protein
LYEVGGIAPRHKQDLAPTSPVDMDVLQKVEHDIGLIAYQIRERQYETLRKGRSESGG